MEDRFYSEGSGEHTAELIIPSMVTKFGTSLIIGFTSTVPP